MIGIDASFLVACELQEHAQHEGVHKILDRFVEENERFALAPQVLAEFLHVVTDGKRLKKPQSMRQALERAELWRTAVEVTMLTPAEGSVDLFFQWMITYRLGRKRVLDTMLAATYASAGVVRLATLNVGDFEVFGVFECIAPSKVN
jgi:predicted nucleic acid-binding protein